MSDIENIKRLINCKYDYINDIITEDNKLSLLYVLQPEEYEELVINNISDNFKYLIGCNYSYVINKLVDNLKYIIKYNSNTKVLYTLQIDEYNKNHIQLSWHETSSIFKNYILDIIENVFPKLIENTDEKNKLATELKKLYNPKAIEEVYNKIYYKYFREKNDDVIIFKNGYLNIKTNEFTETIIRKFDEENQYMNISYNNYESSLSKDYNINFILSILNKIFYNKINNSINIIIGQNTCNFVNKINELFNTYVANINIKDFYKNNVMKKIIFIICPDEVDLTKVCNKLNNQHIFLCCGFKTPKMTGLLNVNTFNICQIESDYFESCTSEELLSDIINSNNEIQEPFTSNIIKESISCDCNSVEYFIRSCLIIDDNNDDVHTEQELYKNYLTFCKNYKLNVSTVTTLVQSLQSKNVHVDGDIGSRNFIGIIFK